MTKKEFWKISLASAIGVLILTILLTGLCFSFFGGLASGLSSQEEVSLTSKSILDINLGKTIIAEQTLEENPFAGMNISSMSTAEEARTVGILDAIHALERAACDPLISAVYIRPDAAGSISHIEEFRAALMKFRESGKPVIAYIQTPTNTGIWLGSAADRVYMSEYHGGMNLMVGLSGSLLFYKDLLDKLGVNVQLIRHGKYKAAGEGFIRNNPSQENLEQNTEMIKSLWEEMAPQMAAKAGITADEFNKLIDNLEIVDANDFVKYGLADETISLSGMKEKLASIAGAEDYEDLPSISFADYVTLSNKKLHSETIKIRDRIAIIYADGEIVDGYGMEDVAGKRFAEMVDEVRKDSNIKAVVLRVNSPGGSVVASSQIKDALDALRAEKPVIASYGAYAASGGYWISACSDYIFSDATTLTGSIGVFGMIPDFSGTLKNIAHVNRVAVSSNKHADMYSLMRPLTDDEAGYIQKDIEAIYTSFTSLVAEGRNMTVEDVDAIGQGRVWTGRDALGIGLVDSIGGIAEAVEYAAQKVGCAQYRLVAYPTPPTALDMIMSMFETNNEDNLVKALIRSQSGFGLTGTRKQSGAGLTGLRGQGDFGLTGVRSQSGFGLTGVRGQSGFGLTGVRGQGNFGLTGVRGQGDFGKAWGEGSDHIVKTWIKDLAALKEPKVMARMPFEIEVK